MSMRLETIVDREGTGTNPRAMADIAQAVEAGEQRGLSDSGGRFRETAELRNTVPYNTYSHSLAFEKDATGGEITTAGHEEQPIAEQAAKIRAELERQLRKGEIDFQTYYRRASLLPTLKITEYFLDTYDSVHHEGLADKIANLLTYLEKNTGLSDAAGFARSIWSKLTNSYTRPNNIAARQGFLEEIMFAAIGKNRFGIAYSKDTIGTAYHGMRNFNNVIKTLDLYKEPELLIEYLIDHEVMHLRHPTYPSNDEEMAKHEIETRLRVYEMYRYSAHTAATESEEKKYRKLARIAAVFVVGHAGVGPMSYIDDNKSLYTGISEVDEPRMYNSPGTGTLDPKVQRAYRANIGHPLSKLAHETGHEEHMPQTHEPAQHSPRQHYNPRTAPKARYSTTHSPQRHSPAQHKTGG
ncbi:hypothetical protein HY640_01470 [Candidatus Woesearchaeota archaeon]|nr:hypothetical protein [Candidatus Woesearchaeota archaeon]